MPEVEFISTYKEINYKVPESNKFAKFHQGRFATKDDQVVSYLREHPDYGVTLTEVDRPGKSIAVEVSICDICGKVFKTRQQLSAHKLSCKPKPEENKENKKEELV